MLFVGTHRWLIAFALLDPLDGPIGPTRPAVGIAGWVLGRRRDKRETEESHHLPPNWTCYSARRANSAKASQCLGWGM